MSDGRLVIGTRRYSSWSMRGWLAVKLAGLDVEETIVPLEGNGQTTALKSLTSTGMVPYLEHEGVRVWESLAICEYCAEQAPGLWPPTVAARAHARAISAEMHAGFRELRLAMPMNLGRTAPGLGRTPGALADIARIETLWAATRADFGGGGPYLFGAHLNLADAMFAPIVARLLTYQPDISPETLGYCQAVRAHDLVAAWYDAAAAEPAGWRLAKYEDLA